jgi:Sulfotransferase family
MPRSGTTWIGKIFDSHPNTIYRHEPDSYGGLKGVALAPSVDNVAHYAPAIKQFVDALPGLKTGWVAAKGPVFGKSYYDPLRLMMRRAAVATAGVGVRLSRRYAVPDFIDPKLAATLPMIWKSIASVPRLGVLARALPNASFVHVVRHPCGYVASRLRERALTSKGWPLQAIDSDNYDLLRPLLDTNAAQRRGLTLRDLRELSPVERLAWCWSVSVEKALEDSDGLSNCKTVLYEDICRQPMEMARRMFSFAGLSWNGQTEEFVDASTTRDVPAFHSVFKHPMLSANRWQQQLTNTSIDRVLAVVSRTRAGNLYAS